MNTTTRAQKTVSVPDVAKKIYGELRRSILDLTIKPGEVIVESDICKRFGVSRTPVREAFQRLTAMGLLKTIPYQGSYATFLNMNQIRQYIYMRIAVETMVLSDFIESATPFHIEELRYNLNLQHVLLQTDFAPALFYEYDSAFHGVWFNHTNKLLLWKMIQRAQVQYKRFRMLDIVVAHNFNQIVSEHEALFAAIEKKEIKQIKSFVQKHLNGGISRLGHRICTDFADYFMPEEREHLEELSKI